MGDVDFLGRGWKYPLEIDKGKIAFSEGEDSIKESIIIILSTGKGERIMRPDFGCEINELVFSPNNSQTASLIAFHIKDALMKWEPRIDVLDVNAYPDTTERNKININIDYMIKTSNTKSNLVYPFFLERP
ncbi:MAG: baseplate protein [Candidatus Methanoperedenaceae archaeon]|nr:MAG: baseplate protein [Candidatus Methanoperedenaceae archaeon]